MLNDCLLIAPISFYSYAEYAKKALISLGYSVTMINDEYPSNFIGKIMGKLQIPLLLTTTEKYIGKNYLEGKKFKLILIIKGRGMSLELIQNLHLASPNVVGYNYDSFQYHMWPLRWFKLVSKYYTFDYYDAAKYSLPIVELFSTLPDNLNSKSCNYDISAILRNHSDRLVYIDKILSALPCATRFIYIFEQNIFTFFQNFFGNPWLYIKYRRYIHFQSLSYLQYTSVLQESNFTIDIVHPSQSGITIRCFEALSAQTKIITNNPFVLRYIHFNSKNTIVLGRTFDSDTLKKQVTAIKNLLPSKHVRTVKNFIQDLIA